MAGERIEAELTVPSSTTVSAATSNQSSPVTITATPGSTFITDLLSDLQTELNADSPPSSGQWTLSLSPTTGLVTIACTDPAYIQFTSTTLRDLLGFEYNFDYPATPAQMATALGYGTWTSGAGYLCNESSGNLASVFGTPATLTADGTPLYGLQGPRGGSDKAIGNDASSDAFTGGSTFNVSTTEDLVLVGVCLFTSAPTSGVLWRKGFAGDTSKWTIETSGSNVVITTTTTSGTTTASAAAPVGSWFVLCAVLERATNKIRIGTCAIGGSPTVSSEVAMPVEAASNANTFAIMRGSGTGFGGTPSVFQCAAFYITSGSGVATGLSANLGTALSNFATYMKSQTGTAQAKGLWLPDCPLMLNGDPTQAPRISDLRTSQSPTGVVLGLAGNTFFRHTGLVYSHVPRAQVWGSAATYENGSWEEFFYETQMGMGSSWFTPASPVQVYYQSAGSTALLGGDYNGTGVSGWTITGLDAIEPKKSIDQWTGLFRIELGTLVSSG